MAEDLSGTVLDGRYRLLRALGVGGMGTVYEAEQVTLEKRVAVKVLKAKLVSTGVHLERFLREAKAASKIRHRNVVDIIDFGRLPTGSAYYVMELLEGTDVAELLRAKGRLTWARTRAIVLQVLSALEAAHAEGVIHRDIKPANVFLVSEPGVDDDVVKVLDFGIAKVADDRELTRADEIVGTATYMAPEQARGIVSEQSDVYAVGVLMYKMLTGRVPFRGANGFETLRLHQTEAPPAMRTLVPDLSAAVEALVMQALSKRPELRFASMAQMQAAVRAVSPGATARRPAGRGQTEAIGSVPTLVRHVPSVTTERAAVEDAEDVPVRDGSTAPAPALEPLTPIPERGGTVEVEADPAMYSGVYGRGMDSTTTRQHQIVAQQRRLLIGITAGLVVTALFAVVFVIAWAGSDDAPARKPAPASARTQPPGPAVNPSPIPTPSVSPPTSDAVAVDPPEGDDAAAGEDAAGGDDAVEGSATDPSDAAGPMAGDDASAAGDDMAAMDEGGDDGLSGDDDAGAGDDGGPADGGGAGNRPRPPKAPTEASVKAKLQRRAKTKCRGLGSGPVEVSFTIKSDGKVMMVVPKPPHASDDLGRCVAKVVAGAQFPRDDDMHPASIEVNP